MTQPNNRRVALITGANKGIGFEAARQLAAQGIHVIVGARDGARGSEAAAKLSAEGLSARSLILDVVDAASIQGAKSNIEANEGRLDILVNNAGIGLEKIAPSVIAITTIKTTMETNFFGAIAVTQALLPLLRRSPAGRIVNVSSSLGSIGRLSDPAWAGYNSQFTAYSLSKSALNSFTALLSAELHGTALKVNSVEPGYTKTDMTGGEGFQTAAEAARVITRLATIDADGPNGGFFDFDGIQPW